jgi:hypothetical protein
MLKRYHQTSLLVVEGRGEGIVRRVGTFDVVLIRHLHDDGCEVEPACGEVDRRQPSNDIRKV